MKETPLFKNDLQKVKFRLQLLDSSFLEEKAGISKFSRSKIKNRDNPEWSTLEKVLSLENSMLVKLENIKDSNSTTIYALLNYFKDKKIVDWMNFLLLDVVTKEDLNFLGYLISLSKENSEILKRIEYFKPSDIGNIPSFSQENKTLELINKVFLEVFPYDEYRNLFKVPRSLILEKMIDLEFLAELALDMDDTEARASYLLSEILKRTTLQEQEAYFTYIFIKELNKMQKVVSEIRSNLKCPDAESWLWDIIKDRNPELRDFKLWSSSLSPGLKSKLLNLGFKEENNYLVFYWGSYI